LPRPCRCCRFCLLSFEPSKFRPDQSVCSQPLCQRQRRGEYHRRKIDTDPVYAQVVIDSRKKWRDAHPDYQKTYRQSHAPSVERNRQMQPRRDAKRRAQFLVKNNLALDLKHSAAEVWLLGPQFAILKRTTWLPAKCSFFSRRRRALPLRAHLEKNNLAACKMFIFQPAAPGTSAPRPS
jgi:hypothetical protein